MTNTKLIIPLCLGFGLLVGCGDDGASETEGGSSSGDGTTTSTSSSTTSTTSGTTGTTTTTTDGSTSGTTAGSSGSDTESGSTGGEEEVGPSIGGGNFAPVGSYTDIFGAGLIVRRADGTDVSIQVSGLTADTEYTAHVHAAACADDDGGGHYKIDPSVDETVESNELWLVFTTDGNGDGRVEITTEHLARADAMAVVVHDSEADGAKMACVDLTLPEPFSDPFVTSDNGNVTVLQEATDDGFGSMTATASMERNIDGSTSVTVSVTGLDTDTDYPVHVHETNCAVADGTGHYKIDYAVGGTDENNELWIPITTDGDGAGTNTYSVSDHIARAEAQSIVIHDSSGGMPPRYACIDLSP